MDPNLDGFKEAQARLINKLGEAVILLTPVAAVYPPDTRFDPESGKPRDPWVRPAASGFASATIKASVAYQHTDPEDDSGSVGIKSGRGLDVIVNEMEFVTISGSAATQVLYGERRYRIQDSTFDPMAARILLHVEPL